MGIEHDSNPAITGRKGAEEHLVASGIEHTVLRTCLHEYAFLKLAWQTHDRKRIWFPGPGTNELTVLPTQDWVPKYVSGRPTRLGGRFFTFRFSVPDPRSEQTTYNSDDDHRYGPRRPVARIG